MDKLDANSSEYKKLVKTEASLKRKEAKRQQEEEKLQELFRPPANEHLVAKPIFGILNCEGKFSHTGVGKFFFTQNYLFYRSLRGTRRVFPLYKLTDVKCDYPAAFKYEDSLFTLSEYGPSKKLPSLLCDLISAHGRAAAKARRASEMPQDEKETTTNKILWKEALDATQEDEDEDESPDDKTGRESPVNEADLKEGLDKKLTSEELVEVSDSRLIVQDIPVDTFFPEAESPVANFKEWQKIVEEQIEISAVKFFFLFFRNDSTLERDYLELLGNKSKKTLENKKIFFFQSSF